MDSASLDNLPDSVGVAVAAPLPASVTVVDNLENLPPPPPAAITIIATTTSSTHSHTEEVAHQGDDHSFSAAVPGPQREEPTLKEKLVDRERQRRKEAERARWKRQFALMSNGGGLVYDDNNNNGVGGAVASSTVGAIGSMSITGTVGEEEESIAHFNEGDDLTMTNDRGDGANRTATGRMSETHVPLGYTMERFLQEGGGAEGTTAAAAAVVPEAITLTSAIIQHGEQSLETTKINNGTNPQTTSPDKGVVMERFLNDPVLVDVPVADLDVGSPPSVGESAADADHRTEPTSHHLHHHHHHHHHHHLEGTDNADVHRSVSFDMELHHQSIPGRGQLTGGHDTNATAHFETSLHNMSSMADSMASVQVEVAPDDLVTMHELNDVPESPPSTALSVPSVRAPSSLAMDDDDSRGAPHHHQHHDLIDDRQSTSPTNRHHHHNRTNEQMESDDDHPRVLRLTEAEIQEMASIEEASIGNAPPSDRDEESLVGELVGDFGAGTAGLGVDAGGSQGTPTTAMESASMFSGGGAARQAVQHHRRTPSDNTPPHHHHRMNNADTDDDVAMSRQSMDDMIDDIIESMSSSASVSSHLVVSPGASVSGSAASVAANPPSEIAGGVDVEGIEERIGVDVVVEATVDTPAPIPVVVDTSNSPDNDRKIESPAIGSRLADGFHDGIRQELLATAGPSPDEIINRRIRPGMVHRTALESTLSPGQPASLSRNITGINRVEATIDEFDFDKHENPMTPNSRHSDSIRDLPEDDDYWTSPGAKMSVSPLHARGAHPYYNDPKRPTPPLLPADCRAARQELPVQPSLSHGATEDDKETPGQCKLRLSNSCDNLCDHPPSEIITATVGTAATPKAATKAQPLQTATITDRAFLEFHAVNMSAVAEKDAEAYVGRNFLARALPMRLVTLMASCFLEMPVFCSVVSNSEQLCRLLGKHQSQLLIGFIPIICAISGNVSLQSSTLTANAISHGQITPEKYSAWIGKEVACSACLGGGMAAILGVLAYYVSGATSTKLAYVIAIAQFLSATTSGCVGTLAPLVNSFLFQRNAGNWGGVLETVIPDIVSAFITAFLSHYILLLIGTPKVPAGNDTCG